MAKSVTAILIGSLQYRGLIDAKETALFAPWREDERASISLEHLLTMTSGLDFTEAYEPGSDATKMLFTEASASNLAMRSPALFPPGRHWSYSSGTANLLARLVYERTGGTTASSIDFLYGRIFRPMGMRHSVFETDSSGVFVGSSYLYASARDWARIGQLMLNGGELNGERILGAEWVVRASTPNNSDNHRSYGYQFWLNGGDDELNWPSLPADSFAANGNRQQVLMIVPSANAAIVRLGWTSGAYPVDRNFAEILAKL